MTKIETMKQSSAALNEKKLDISAQMTALQMMQSLAASFEPLTEAMLEMSKQVTSIDQRLAKLEAQLPMDKQNRRLALASAQSIDELRSQLSKPRGFLGKLAGQQ